MEALPYAIVHPAHGDAADLHAPGLLHTRRTRLPRSDNQWRAEAFWSGSPLRVVGVHQILIKKLDFGRPPRHAMHAHHATHAPRSTLVACAVILWASYARHVVGEPTGRRLYPPEEDSPVTRCLARNRYLCGRGLHSFPFPLNLSWRCPFPLNLSVHCPPHNPK
jgi:hypothetical protein